MQAMRPSAARSSSVRSSAERSGARVGARKLGRADQRLGYGQCKRSQIAGLQPTLDKLA
jgi:hypothetical protein